MEPKQHNHVKFASGAQRSDRTGKGRFDLISPFGLKRLAIQYEEGSEHHEDERNWELGFLISRAICSALGHLNDHLMGDRSEDHLAAGSWQLFAAMHFEELIEQGKLPTELNDVPFDANTLPPDTGDTEFMAAVENDPVPDIGLPVSWENWFAQEHDLSAMQRTTGSWAEEHFPGMTNEAIWEHLQREVKELSFEFAPEEAADCFLILLHFAHKNKFNLLGEALKKHKINTERKWAAIPDEQGIYLHIDEE